MSENALSELFVLGQIRKYAFFARLKYNLEKLAERSIVKFDDVVLNAGDCYSAESGKFTAPEDGLYIFSWTTLSKKGGDFSSGLIVNRKKIIANIVDSDKVPDVMTGSMSAVVEMKTGQKAWLQVVRDEGTHIFAEWLLWKSSAFTGFKL